MDRTMKKKTLATLLMSRFTVIMVAIMLLSAPVFYLIVTNFYAEDLREAVAMAGADIDTFDLEEDTVVGLVFQILTMVAIVGLTVFAVMRIVPVRLWAPFYKTLHGLEAFRVEDGRVPAFDDTRISEFSELNDTLRKILSHSVRSYQVQKQFTENASHELQTPLAIVQGKLDLLMQDASLTERQATLIQAAYHELNHMALLNRNLLLLARIENSQYKKGNRVNLGRKLRQLLPSLELLSGDLRVVTDIDPTPLTVDCNEVLLESMVTNLFVNAVRHNREGGSITIHTNGHSLAVENTSQEGELDRTHLFERFYRSASTQKGNGLGLAIVKSICEYHGWAIDYQYADGIHAFTVDFSARKG